MKTAAKITAFALCAVLAAGMTSCGSKIPTGGFDGASSGLDENGFFEGIKASELVELPEYKGIEIDKDVSFVSDEEVQEQIDSVLSYYSYYEQVTDRLAVDGDTVNVDYVGYIGAEPFEGGDTAGNGDTITIGTTEYIDGFVEQLIGKMPGESFKITVTLADDYKKEELRGKEVVFDTVINYIQGDYIVPELSDEIAADYGYENVDAMMEDMKKDLHGSEKFYFAADVISGAICDEVPQAVIDYLINFDRLQLENEAASYGVTLEDVLYAYYATTSFDDYVAMNQDTYKENGTLYLAAQAIAETEGLTVTAEDIEAAGYSEYIDVYGEPYIKQFMLFQEIIPQFILDNGVLVETPADGE